MVPMRSDALRSDACETRPLSFRSPDRPALVLQDVSAAPAPRRRSRRSPIRRIESALLATAAAAVVLFLLFSFALSLFHTVQQNYQASAGPSQIVISKTVSRGETLTHLAQRFGDPSVYILDREEAIARLNHLSGTAPLLPGQRLRIPVTNPTVITRIEQAQHHTVLASR